MTTPTEQQLFLNSRELAERLGVSSMSVTRMRRAGRLPLPCYASAGSTIWALSDVEAWEANGKSIDAERANDAGRDACHRADRAAFDDQQRGPLPDVPELREAIAHMRAMADICERVLNESGNFVKPPVKLPAVDRCRLTSDDAAETDTI